MNRIQKFVMLLALPLFGVGIGFVLGMRFMLAGGALGLLAGLYFFIDATLRIEHPREQVPSARHTTVALFVISLPFYFKTKRVTWDFGSTMLRIFVRSC